MKFSILLLTYNRLELLAHTLQSLRLQTHKDFEVFVVDRGSVPSAEGAVTCLNDSRFNYIRSTQSNHACDDAEKVISQMNGDFFCFLADDDVLLANAFELVNEWSQKFSSVEYFTAGFAVYDFTRHNLDLCRNYTGELKLYKARLFGFSCICSWGIGLNQKYPAPPQSHSSLIFLKRSLVERTRISQRELFVKSFGDIGYVGALLNTEDFLHADIPLGVLGSGHVRETDGITNRFKHKNELVHLEHVPNRTVACFDNIGLDAHLKVLYRNQIESEYPPYIRPKAFWKQLKIIMRDRPLNIVTLRDALMTSMSLLRSLINHVPMVFKRIKPNVELPTVLPDKFCSIGKSPICLYKSIGEAAKMLKFKIQRID